MAPSRSFILVPALSLLLIAQAWAETLYVAPNGAAELRSGLAVKDKVMQSLAPNTPLKVLKTDKRRGYAKVQLDSGQMGWVSLKLTTGEAPRPAQPPPTVAIPEVPPKSAQELQAEVNHLQTELIAIRQASSNILRIQAERDQLQESVISLRKELDSALRDKYALNDDQKQSWFLIGSLVLFVGILLGVMLPRLSVRRRSHWSSF
jgi:SH3 domain protein